MKFALVLFDWFPHGGLQRDCRHIAESLQRAGAQVSIIAMSWQGEVPEGIERVLHSPSGLTRVARRRAFAAFIKEHCHVQAYDAVFGFNRLPGLDYYFAADTCFAWKAYHERAWWYRLSSRTRQYLAFERAVFGEGGKAVLFMLSPLQKEEYARCYPSSVERMIDVPPGIDRNRCAGNDADEVRRNFRNEFGLSEETLLILQVGTGYPVKGLDRSLKAIAALPDSLKSRVRFFVIGSDQHGRYMKLASSLGIAACVTFLEGRNDLPRFYQGADFLLQPSRKESAGMVLLEAVVAGLPVLTTASCGYAFHVEQSGAGRVVPEPFKQETLNGELAFMLQSDEKARWRSNGIAYGQAGDFYDMPDRVATILMEKGPQVYGRE